MAFRLRSLSPNAAAVAVAAAAPFSSPSYPLPRPSFLAAPSGGSSSTPVSVRSSPLRRLRPVRSALHMDPIATPPNQPENGLLPELLTEFMVDMKCDGCVSSVKNKLFTIDGVKSVEADLANLVVRVLGTSTVKDMTNALEQTGRKARLIGRGVPEEFLVSASVAEFKGPVVFGVVRFAQVSMELARVEASFSGLTPGRHGWSINEYGDLTRGAGSTGKVYNHPSGLATDQPQGDLGTLDANYSGEASFSGAKEKLRVADLIGRSVVVYETEDKSVSGITAAVIARSAGVGENYKKVCLCDGTTIWESTNADFVTA